jgi:hypothetical protein
VRDWWIRTLLVLSRPRPVFVALRDDSRTSLSDRAEPVLAIVILGGIAWALSTTTAAHLMDDSDYDAAIVAVWAFIVGGVYGFFGYFAIGGVLHAAVRALGSQGTYRRTRHVLAFAAVPLALSLALLPVRLALYGDDIFRSGGSDAGTGAHVFTALEACFAFWALALLVVGVRALTSWGWPRSLVAVGAFAALLAGADLALSVLGG